MNKIILFAMLVLVSITAQAYDPDARNDFMCVAIFKVAFEQDGTKDHPQYSRFYSDRIKVFRWKLLPTNDTYEQTVFNNRVNQYMDELDSADVLLHMQRCKYRVVDVYMEYVSWKNNG